MNIDELDSHDRQQLSRFELFMRYAGSAPKLDGGRLVMVSDETWRYLRGEDVDPTPYVDGIHQVKMPAGWERYQ